MSKLHAPDQRWDVNTLAIMSEITGAWGTGIDILIDIMIKFACYLYLVCHEKPELMLRVRFTTSSSAEKSLERGQIYS